MPSERNCSTEKGKARRAILVLGPHRSGTSVVARALLAMDVNLGQNLLPPNTDNPRGFFENARLVEFNDRLLKQLGICWDYLGPAPSSGLDIRGMSPWIAEAHNLIQEEFPDSICIGIKDPRLCLLAPFWSEVLSAGGFATEHILVLRHPVECAESQASRLRRDPAYHFIGGDLDEGLMLWARYLREALRYLEDKSVVVASYSRFLESPNRALEDLASALDLKPDGSASTEFGLSFLDPGLHRHHGDALNAQNAAWASGCLHVWRMLKALDATHPHRGSACTKATDALNTLFAAAPTLVEVLLRVFVRTRHVAVESNLELAHAKQIIAWQQHALDRAKHQVSELEDRAVVIQNRLISERAEYERLTLENATLRDRLASHGDPLGRNPH